MIVSRDAVELACLSALNKARAKAGYLRAVSVLDVDTVSSGALPLLLYLLLLLLGHRFRAPQL